MNNIAGEGDWGKLLSGALEKTRKERAAYKQRMGELEAHKEAMGNIGPWDAWGGRLSRYQSPRGYWLRDNDTGIFLDSVTAYRTWRVNCGHGYGRTHDIGVEWSYLIGGGAPEWDRRVWVVESSDELLIWDMRTGCWLVDEAEAEDMSGTT